MESKIALPDYSEWLTTDRVGTEEAAWSASQLHMNYAAHIALMRTHFGIFSILELGCGSGWVPTQLTPDIAYVGVDKNAELLAIARTKNISSERRNFIQADIRDAELIRSWGSPDLVCSFAVLKHFSLDEFEKIFSGMLSISPRGLFSMNIANENRDDGFDFHHIWITNEWLKQILDKNRFDLVYKTIVWQGKTWETKTGEEAIFGVKRRK